MPVLSIMSAREGHQSLEVAPPGEEVKEGQISQEEANRRFDELIGKNYLAFSATATGETGTQVRTFDPEAEELLMVPPMVGG